MGKAARTTKAKSTRKPAFKRKTYRPIGAKRQHLKARNVPHVWKHLPFIHPNTDPASKREHPLSFWSVKTTGEYVADYGVGEQYAAVFMLEVIKPRSGNLLALIAMDTCRSPEARGVAVGSWSTIEKA